MDQYREQAALTFAADGSCDPVPEEPGGSQDEPEDPQGQGSLTEDGQQDAQNADAVSVPKTGDGSAAVPGVIAVMALCCSAGAAAPACRKNPGKQADRPDAGKISGKFVKI